MTEAKTAEHRALRDTQASRRYFRKFEAISERLGDVAAAQVADRALDEADAKILTRYLARLAYTFKALSMKYLLVGRETGQFFGSLQMDAVESGFPVFNELLVMANDAQQAEAHLRGMPDSEALKDEMIRKIIGEQEIPTRLQFALSQRLYYEELMRGEMFWAQNHPEVYWLATLAERRRKFMVHWAVYDSQINLPTIYVMEVEDSGKVALPRTSGVGRGAGASDEPELGFELVTIARGLTRVDDLHPKRLRRYHVGRCIPRPHPAGGADPRGS